MALDQLASLNPPEVGVNTVIYIGGVGSLGALGSIVRLLGDEELKVTWRAVIAYLASGLVAGLCIVFLFSSYLGFSWVSLGISGLAGFGAMDLLALGVRLVATGIKRVAAVFFPETTKKGKNDE